MRRHISASIFLAALAGVVLVALAVQLATSGLAASTRVYGLLVYAGIGIGLVAAVMVDQRRARERGHITLSATPRLRVVQATRNRVEGFRSVCDPITMGNIGWTEDDVRKLEAQFDSKRGELRLVLERRTGRVIGCVIPKRVGFGLVLVGWIGPEHRRQGYGSELLDQLCTDAFSAGCRSVLMALPAADPGLVPFMEQRQFVATGTHKLLGLHDTLIDTLLYRRMPSGQLPIEESTPTHA